VGNAPLALVRVVDGGTVEVSRIFELFLTILRPERSNKSMKVVHPTLLFIVVCAHIVDSRAGCRNRERRSVRLNWDSAARTGADGFFQPLGQPRQFCAKSENVLSPASHFIQEWGTFEQIVEAAKAQFPTIWARFTFTVKLRATVEVSPDFKPFGSD
jgi:hypothetical protein